MRARLRAYGRLLRLSLAPSAAADVVAGLVYGGAGAWPDRASAWWLVPASLGVYHGALALNDWNDREHDARTRSGRAIPAGLVSPRAALVAGFALVLVGILCAGLAQPECALWMGSVAVLALAYDFAGRGPWLGPILLALCRAGNLGSGIFFAQHACGGALDSVGFLPCAAYGLYVFLVSRLGRMEDAEDAGPLGRRPSHLLVAIAVVLLLPPCLPGTSNPSDPMHLAGRILSGSVALCGAFGLVQCALRTAQWTRALVERAMGLALRRLLVFTAAVALMPASIGAGDLDARIHRPGAALLTGAAILCGYPLAWGLRKLFPPS